MSSFTAPLAVRKIPGSKLEWVVAESFRYYIGELYSDEFVEVGAGTETDLASLPLIRRVFEGDQAAVVHDVLYRRGSYRTHPFRRNTWIQRKRADEIFHEAMLVLGVHPWRAGIYYAGVRAMGWHTWNKHRAAERIGVAA